MSLPRAMRSLQRNEKFGRMLEPLFEICVLLIELVHDDIFSHAFIKGELALK